jgi:hypothetical protein
MFSPSQNNKLTGPAPFATVALAGRNTMGGYCTCACPGCICDEGEQPGLCLSSAGVVTDEAGDSFSQAAPVAGDPEMFDFGSGALIVALAFLAWARFRVQTF